MRARIDRARSIGTLRARSLLWRSITRAPVDRALDGWASVGGGLLASRLREQVVELEPGVPVPRALAQHALERAQHGGENRRDVRAGCGRMEAYDAAPVLDA